MDSWSTNLCVFVSILWGVGGCIGQDAESAQPDTVSAGIDSVVSDHDSEAVFLDGLVLGDSADTFGEIADAIDHETQSDGVDQPETTAVDDTGTADAMFPDAHADIDTLPQGPGLMGVLVDETGVALEKVKVLACMAKTCYYGESGIGGQFLFHVDPPAEIALKTLGNPTTDPKQGAALVPVLLTDDTLVDCGMVYVPFLPDGVKVGPISQDPQTLQVGGGLELTINRADIKMPPGEILTEIAATLVPHDQIPAIPAIEDTEQVVAMYALHPFSAKSTSPIAVIAPSTLPDKTSVFFRTISSLDGTLSTPAMGTSDGKSVSTADGQGILELTRIVISIPKSL